MKKVTFQYISDLHLDHGHKNPIDFHNNVLADILLVAGDVASPYTSEYRLFLTQVAPLYKHVFIIAGNHEYYVKTRCEQKYTMHETEDKIRSILKEFDNIHFLQNESFAIPDTDILIYGTTLWSEIEDYDSYMVSCMISDYKCIPGFTVNTNNWLHHKAVSQLTRTIEDNPDKIIIVLCHHIPQKRLISRKYLSLGALNDAFASNVPILDKATNVQAVVYGHTHCINQNDKYYCNPVGYPDEKTGWSLSALININV